MTSARHYFAALLLTGPAWLSPARAADVPPAAPDVVQKLEQHVDALQQQLDEMKKQLQQLKAQNEALASAQQQQALQQQQPALQAQQPQQSPQSPQGSQPVQVASTIGSTGLPRPGTGGISPNLSLWGYGEVYYTHPTHVSEFTEFDLARAVFGIGYRFDDRTVFNSEYEVEHAVASSTDKGEFEVEQFYIDRQLTPWASVKAGLFLMPFGLLNEYHEPTNFYGVQRNFVETLIIPSTWREGGIGFHGNTDIGLKWDVGLTTGLDLNGWNNNPEEPLYRTALDLEDNDVAPMQATHQEAALANAHHLSQYVALNYNGVPGFLVGAAISSGDAVTATVPAGLPTSRVTLWEGHARWTPGAAEFSAVYARGRISNTAEYNLVNTGVSNPLPAEFLGYYGQAAYTVWQRGGYRLAPFARFEYYNMGASYEGIAPGFPTVPTGVATDGLPWPQPNDHVFTVGANFYLSPQVVFKVDYQTFDVNKDLTRFDVGMGLAF